MATYEYTIRFRKTQKHGNADAISRLPLLEVPSEKHDPPELVFLMDHLAESPVTAQHIRTWTRRDPILAPVLQFVWQGWPDNVGGEYTPYASRKLELSAHEGCVVWGSRVIIPPRGRKAVLQELHEGHPGMSRMKSFARMHVWWPGLEDVENHVREGPHVKPISRNHLSRHYTRGNGPRGHGFRLHLDFAGPVDGKMFLVLINAHSKWIEIFPTNGSTSAVVIESLRTTFARFRLPDTIVSDNGSCFVSEEFLDFLTRATE